MKEPEWLADFPYLHAQWPGILSLRQEFPELLNYNLASDWDKFKSGIQKSGTNIDWFAQLRQFRQTRLAYFAFQDLFKPITDHLKTMHLVADLAALLVRHSHQIAADYMNQKFGRVLDSNGEPVELMIWALGKLGTRELNYSSDVDLVFLYPCNGQSDGDRSLDAASYFMRMGQKIIKLLDHFTSHGQVYRVDMRLRPFGSSGPLACSVPAFQQYIQYEGREWERFAWMRARMISGSDADAVRVSEHINPFIYRKHLDYAVFDALVKIKTEISDHLVHEEDDLKQGAGGIRAVEFIVQSLQLVFGGRNPELQGVSIKNQIRQVIKAGKLPAEDGEALNLAWLWLRKLENISQCVNDQATHTIPDNPTVKGVLCRSFGFNEWQDMELAIKKQRQLVTEVFSQIFEQAEDSQVLPSEQRQQLQSLMNEFSGKQLPAKRLENLEKLLQNTILWANEPVITEFLVLLKNILTRPNYILMLLKESNVHKSVLNLMSKHDYFVDTLQQYPVLLEHLFERQLNEIFSVESLTSDWQKRNVGDVEEWMEALRYFKLEHQFNLILAYTENQISRKKTLQQMTELALFVLSEVVQYAHHEMVYKLGFSDLPVDDLIIIAYGSAATNQMTVDSDMDLVFVLDIEQFNPDVLMFAQKWIRRIIHHLITPMYHGKLYELDMQLRPNGNSGALVTTKNEFIKYQSEQAWIWEHAAMIKSRAVYGTAEQMSWHHDLRSEVLAVERDVVEVEQAMKEMAEKLAGSVQVKSHQVEFKVLSKVLTCSHQFPQLLSFESINQVKVELVKLGLLTEPEVSNFEIKKDPAS